VAKTRGKREERERGKKQEKREQKKEQKKKKKLKNKMMEIKKVAEEWEIWDEKKEAAKFKEETKILVSQRFYK